MQVIPCIFTAIHVKVFSGENGISVFFTFNPFKYAKNTPLPQVRQYKNRADSNASVKM